MNLYEYVYGNPLDLYDPDGMTAKGAWEGFRSFFVGNARNIYHGARTLHLTGARDYDWAGTENNMLSGAASRYANDSCFRRSANLGLRKFAEHISRTHGDAIAARMATGFFSKEALIKGFGKTKGNIAGVVLIAGAANGDLRYQVEQFANQLRQLGMNEIEVGATGITAIDFAGLAGRAMLTGSLSEEEINDAWDNFKKSCDQ